MRVTAGVTVRPVPVVMLLIGVLVGVTVIDHRFRPVVHAQRPAQVENVSVPKQQPGAIHTAWGARRRLMRFDACTEPANR
jgi:hypothetical protein